MVQSSIPAPSLADSARIVFVYLPASYEGPDSTQRFPVVYFLHGGPGWPGDWLEKGTLATILDSLIATRQIPELIAVLPDGRGLGRKGMSLWADSWDGRSRIGKFLDRDVPAWIDRTFRTLPEARDRALVGISDGGDGAINHALRAPGIFGAAAGLSGCYHPHGSGGLEAIAGPEPYRSRYLASLAPLTYLDSVAASARGQFFYLDSGLADARALDCVEMDHTLSALGIPHEAHTYLGWHDWSSWRRRLPLALAAVTAGFRRDSPATIAAENRWPGSP